MEFESSGRSDSRRLHPSSLLFRLFGHIKPFAVPLLLAFAFTGGNRTEAWLAIAVGPLMLFEVWRYFTFRYRFTEEGLVVREGLIFRNERLVPYARIQNVDTRQGLFHRPLDVLDVRIETATGSEPEAKLTVITRARLAELEQHLGRATPARVDSGELSVGTGKAEPGRVLYELATKDAVLLGLSPWRGLAVVGVIFGLFAETQGWDQLDSEVLDRGLVRLPSFDALDGVLLGFVYLVPAVFLLIGLSIFMTLVRLYGFRVERNGSSLRVTSGLFTRHHTNLEVARIQTVSVRRPWLLRRLQRASVRITTAAAVEDLGEEAATRQWFAPVVAERDLERLLNEIDSRLVGEAPNWQPLAPSATRRMTLAALARVAVIALPLVSFLRLWSIPILVLLVVGSVLHARRAAKRAAFATRADLVSDRDGVLTQRETYAFVERIQGVGVHESPFDRRHGTAQFRVDTAGGSKLVPAVRIPYLERDRADALHAELLRQVAAAT